MMTIRQFIPIPPGRGLFRSAFVAALLLGSFIRAGAQQRGTIGGRIITEDGAAMPGVTVFLSPYGSNRLAGQPQTTLTDEEGSFRFNNLQPRSYVVSVSDARSYVQAPLPSGDAYTQRFYRVGETVTITLVKGGVIT